jgi:GTPase SAR1 family protein
VFLTFDITNYQSFKDILDWQQEIENNADEGIIKYLVGNFADLEDERQVSKEEAEQLVKKLGFHHYVETSAFTGQNVGLLFETLTKHLFVANEFNLNEFVSDC